MGTQVLVTGGNGQLAQTIKALYFKNEEDIQFTFLNKAALDITNLEVVAAFFATRNFDYCINCAAYTNVEQAESAITLAFKINAEAVKHLATVCKANKTVLIHISTDYVFDGQKKTPYIETDLTNPINQYGKSKLKGEHYILDISKEYFIIRTSWLYSNFGKNFVKTIVNKIKENADLKITTAETGSPTSCIDLSAFIYYVICIKSKEYGIYHYSNAGKANWYEFAVEIASSFNAFNGKNISPVDGFKSSAKRPKYSVMSKTKIIKNFNMRPNKWEKALTRVLETL